MFRNSLFSQWGVRSAAWFSPPNCAPCDTMWGKKQELKLVAAMPFKFASQSASHSTARCDGMWLIETCLSERMRRRMIKETANTGVALYLLGR